MKVGSKDFENASIDRKINLLVQRGYKQAAFKTYTNAVKFAKKWRAKGYKTSLMRSSGTVTEGGYQRNAFYVTAYKR